MKEILKYSKWLWKKSDGVRGQILLNIILGILGILLNLAFIWFSKQLVDIATSSAGKGNPYLNFSSTHSAIVTLSCIIASLLIFRIVINAIMARFENNNYSKMNFIIRKILFSDLLQSQWQGKEKMHSGDKLNRLFTDVDTVTRVICQDFPGICTTLFQLAAAFVFLGLMDMRLALLIILLTPAMLLFSKVFVSRLRKLTKDIREDESKIQGYIQENIQNKIIIQTLELNKFAEDKLVEMQDSEYQKVRQRTNFNVFSRTIVSAAFGFGYLAALVWGVFGIYEGSLTFGMLAAFLQLVGQVQGPSIRLAREIPGLVYATSSIDRLDEIEKSEKEIDYKPVTLTSTGGISIENISFRYPDGDRYILQNFSFDFKPGSRTAIVGETGIGKSTLIRLILSLLKPDTGGIYIYNDTEKLPVSANTRRNLVYVPQGNSLFSGSIRENLLMGKPDATESEMFDALKIAAAEFVSELPEGLDTQCGERGGGLSEGQAQRIAIARGLMRPGSIMLLDELSSSLDPETEERMLKNLNERSIGKTIIFITHREAVSKYCDNELKLT